MCKCNVGYYGDVCGQQAVEAPPSVTCAPVASSNTEDPSVTVEHTADTTTSMNVNFTTASPSVESTCPVCPNVTMGNTTICPETMSPNTTQCSDTTPCPVCRELITAAPCPEVTTAAPEVTTSCPTPEAEMDYCSENPCQNSGTCYNGTSGFICKCDGLWGGLNCTEGNKSIFQNIYSDTCRVCAVILMANACSNQSNFSAGKYSLLWQFPNTFTGQHFKIVQKVENVRALLVQLLTTHFGDMVEQKASN